MYTCTFCTADRSNEGGGSDKFTFTSIPAWFDHLSSEQHRNVQRSRGAAKSCLHWDPARTLVVSGIFGLKTKDLMVYFGGFGDLQNFFYFSKQDGNGRDCKVLMAEVKSAKAIHKTGHHTLNNITFQTRIQNQPPAKAPPPSVMGPEPSTIKISDKFKRLHPIKDEGGFNETENSYRCRICEVSINSSKESDWIFHLLSAQHQNVHRDNQHLRKVLWDLDKKVCIKQVGGVLSGNILRYLCSIGPVLDFSYLAKKEGGTAVCYALFKNRDSIEQIVTVPHRLHPIPGGKKQAIIIPVKTTEKLKWRTWGNKLLRTLGSEPVVYISEEENNDDEDEDVNPLEIKKTEPAALSSKPNTAVVLDSKKRPHEEDEKKMDIKFAPFVGLSIEEQLKKLKTHFGWSSSYLSDAVKFIDSTVGKLALKHKKLPFGDLVTGLGLQDEPILQLLVDVQDILDSSPTPEASNSSLLSMMKTVSVALDKMKETQKQAQAQNKIINLSTFSSPTSNQFEISLTCSVSSVLTNLKLHFSNSLPFHECSLFNFYCQLDPRVRPMTFLLGYWANSGQIFTSKSQSYPSQFIVMLVLSFLIQSKILPSVQKLQEILSESSSSTEKNKLIGASNVSFCSNLSQVQKIHPPSPLLDLFKDDSILSMSILGLTKDWFKFFATADLTENAIVTRFGLLVPKKDFQPGAIGNLPGDLGRVYRFGTPGGSPKKADMKKFMFSTTPLCIQHPFDLSLNMSRDVGQGQVQKFQESCQNSGSILADLLTHDQPDLTLFLSSLGQNEEIDNANVIKKVKTESPQNSKQVVVIDIDPPVSVSSTTSGSVHHLLKSTPSPSKIKDNSGADNTVTTTTPTRTQVASSSKSKATSPEKARPSASDFFDDKGVKMDQVQDDEEPDDDDDDDDDDDEADEDEDEEQDDTISNISDATSKDYTLTLNISLFKYFARTFAGTEDMKYPKLQLLILQFILEFNQKFWNNCFGLKFLPKVGQKFWPEDFAQILSQGKEKSDQTLLQKVIAIGEKEKSINLSFQVKTDNRIIHKIFQEENPELLRPKLVASSSSLTNFSLLLYEEVPESRLQQVRNESFSTANAAIDKGITFECRLTGQISTTFSNSTPLATLTIAVVGQGHSALTNDRIDVIKAIYRKLGQSYINKMVKRWLYEGSDFNEKKTDNFVKSRNQKWNKKAKKNKKSRAKYEKKMEQQRLGGVSKPGQGKKVQGQQGPRPLIQPLMTQRGSYRPQTQQQIQSRMSFSPGLGQSSGSGFLRPRAVFSYGAPRPQQGQFGGQGQFQSQRIIHPFQTQGQFQGPSQHYDQPPHHHYQQQPQRVNYGPGPSYEEQPERILRNPGVQGQGQGSQTFYSTEQLSNLPQTQSHLLPNPQFLPNNLNQQDTPFHNEPPNDQLYFQGAQLPPQPQHRRPLLGNNPHSHVAGINNYNNNQSFHPNFQNQQNLNPPQFPSSSNNYHLQQNQNMNNIYKPLQDPYPQNPSFNNNKPEYNINIRFNQEPPNNYGYEPQPPQMAPLIPNPLFNQSGQQFNNNNNIPPLFPESNRSTPTLNLNPNARHFNTNPRREQSGPGPVFGNREKLPIESSHPYSRRRPEEDEPLVLLPLQDQIYPNRNPSNNIQIYPNNDRGSLPNPQFNNNNRPRPAPLFPSQSQSHVHSSNFMMTAQRQRPPQRSNPSTSIPSLFARPAQAPPIKRGFISGGHLSTDKEALESKSDSDDDIQIIYDLDPKGTSSPPPPPQKRYKLGAPFPVPTKPNREREPSVSPSSFFNEPTPSSSLSRYESMTQGQGHSFRRGYISSSGSTSNFQNQAENPHFSSSQMHRPSSNEQFYSSAGFYGGRRF